MSVVLQHKLTVAETQVIAKLCAMWLRKDFMFIHVHLISILSWLVNWLLNMHYFVVFYSVVVQITDKNQVVIFLC